MPDSTVSTDATPWTLTQHQAALQAGLLKAQLNLALPAVGLSDIQLGHEEIPGNLLAAQFGGPASSSTNLSPQQPLESYIRLADLIATYEQTETQPFRPQVYWRVLPVVSPVAVAALELIASTQTSLLDSQPRMSVSTALPALELWRLTSLEKAEFKQVSLAKTEPQFFYHTEGPGCYLWRLSGERWSLAEMLLPSDFHSTLVTRDKSGLVRLSHRLFERSLEKGVILRARVRSVWLERGRDAVTALDWYRDLLHSVPPLTT